MSEPRNLDAAIAAMFAERQPELPARTLDAVRQQVHDTRQRMVVGTLPIADLAAISLLAMVVVIVAAIGLGWFALRVGPEAGAGGGGSPTPTATATATAPTTPTPAVPSSRAVFGPAVFVSPLYGETVALQAGWTVLPAVSRWDGRSEPGPFFEADTFNGPAGRTVWAYAGPFSGDLAALVQNRIAATRRDHSDTCPDPNPAINRTTSFAGQPAVLLGWNCGGVINAVVTIRAGTAWEFAIRDLSVQAASDPAVTAAFQSFLATVQLPS